VKRNDIWFVQLYEALRPAVTGMARKYAHVWGVEADDLVQVAGYALWTSCARYRDRPLSEQLRIGNTVARRTMLHWCDREGHDPTHLGTAGSAPWFASSSADGGTAPAEDA